MQKHNNVELTPSPGDGPQHSRCETRIEKIQRNAIEGWMGVNVARPPVLVREGRVPFGRGVDQERLEWTRLRQSMNVSNQVSRQSSPHSSRPYVVSP
jgi:hypothetical protein